MADRLTVIVLGDESAVGTRPVSELTAINPAYDDAQTDCFIWNPTAAAWQNLQPGVNSNPSSAVPSDRWGPVARLRESLRSHFPTENVYVVMHAKDSTLAHTSAKPSWSPHVTGSCFSELVTQITDAAAAAHAVGDTLKIGLIFGSLFTDDFKLTEAFLSYGANWEGLVTALRRVIPTIPYCSAGSLNPQFTSTPVIVVEPAYKTPSVALDVQWKLSLSRGQLTRYSQDIFQNVRILRSSQYAIGADNKTFNASAMVAIGNAISATLYPVTPSWSGQTDAPVAILLGDSICEGVGFNAELPAHLQAALTDANIWNDKVGSIQTLQAGVNNQITLDPGGGLHGIEIRLGDRLRSALTSVWMLKAAAPGSTSGLWHPSTDRYFWHAMVLPWLRNLIDQMRAASKKPVLKLVSVCLGTNDVLNGSVDFAELKSCLRHLPEQIRVAFAEQGLSIDGCRFVFALPAETITPATARVTAARQVISDVAAEVTNATTVDLNGISTLDNIHPNTAGTAAYAELVFRAFADQGTLLRANPLFAPSRDALVKALRLSGVREENDASTMIDAAIQTVRSGFVQKLGKEKVSLIQQMPFNSSPETEAEHFRVLAFVTEIKWCRAQLLRSMPTLFMDGTARLQSWQDEAAFRETSYLQTRDELGRLDKEVQFNLDLLDKQNLSYGINGITVTTVSPDSSSLPGDTVFKAF